LYKTSELGEDNGFKHEATKETKTNEAGLSEAAATACSRRPACGLMIGHIMPSAIAPAPGLPELVDVTNHQACDLPPRDVRRREQAHWPPSLPSLPSLLRVEIRFLRTLR
jgi:hypothetical protein